MKDKVKELANIIVALDLKTHPLTFCKIGDCGIAVNTPSFKIKVARGELEHISFNDNTIYRVADRWYSGPWDKVLLEELMEIKSELIETTDIKEKKTADKLLKAWHNIGEAQ